MIIGTAGHIDHGKTALVRALTGVETDRLPEEKRRGISIELGYAYLHAPDGTSLGFVDVPGHERLLHTMLAGASGIAHALLIVAADDGVMPQTREHLAVVALLGVARATVAITKIDRLDPATRAARLTQVQAEVRALLAPTPLADAPMFPVSALSGEGVEALREHLLAAARKPHADRQHDGPRDGARAFRLAVDRAFTLAGVGTVVTGSVASGSARVGDELHIAPSPNGGARSVRVRGIHAQNQPAEEARAGQRCALALAGVAKDDIRRGDWVCAPAIALTTTRIDVQCQLWPDEPKALRSGTPVHVHLGTSDLTASIVLLDCDTLAPGGTALAQLVLHGSVAAWHGDRGVLRDASATRTVAGVRVLDPFAPQRYRRTPERLAQLAAQLLPDRAARIAALLQHAPLGLDLAPTARAEALPGPHALPLPADAIRIAGGGTGTDSAIAPAALQALQAQTLDKLRAFHAASPEEIGPDTRRLKRLAAPRAGDALWQHITASLTASQALARSGHWLHLPEHAARMDAVQEQLATQLMPPLLAGGFDPPWVRTLAKDLNAPEALVRQTLASLGRRGEVFQVVKDLYYPLPAVEHLAAIARDCMGAGEALQAAAFRDATGLGRKRAIQLLEFFDRVGFTRRVKDAHLLRPGAPLFGGSDG